MAASPRYKVYTPHGQYEGCTKHTSTAGCLASLLGEGATVRLGHRKMDTIWTEGEDGYASESYDVASDIMQERIEQMQQ